MRLAVSHSYFNKKLEEFGQGNDDGIRQMMELEEKQLQNAFPTPEPEVVAVIEVNADDDDDSNLSDASKSILAKHLALIEDKQLSDLEIDFALPVMKTCFRKFQIQFY